MAEVNAKFEYVFVYGTLMKGMSRHSEMQDGCTLVCEGTVQGNLYISDYPGLVAGSGTVQGELYQASDMFQILQRLDWIEGAGGSNLSYNRVIQEVQPARKDSGLTPAMQNLRIRLSELTLVIGRHSTSNSPEANAPT